MPTPTPAKHKKATPMIIDVAWIDLGMVVDRAGRLNA
jgi:hypothetical protein